MQLIATDVAHSVICARLSLCVGHTGELCKITEPIKMLLVGTGLYEPNEP